MSFRDHFTASTWLGRALTGRTARRVYFAIILFLLATSAVMRVYSFVRIRRIQAVVAGLSKLHIDETTEEEVSRSVPYLMHTLDQDVRRSVEVGDIDTGVERSYYVTISNQSNWMTFSNFAERFSRVFSPPTSWIFDAANVLGYWYIGFGALVVLLNGRVSSVSYGVANELVFPEAIGDIVLVKSIHGRWAPRQVGFEVSSIEDESPQFDVDGDDRHLRVLFTPDASPELQSHAFEVNLRCFWSLLGCRHARDVEPLLWRDKNAIEAATLARLKSNDPCPDRILAARVRYLPDVDVLLLESAGSAFESISEEGRRIDEPRTRYKLEAVLRGHLSGLWGSVRSSATIPYPGDYTRKLPNRGLQWTKAGENVLAFSHHYFDSCRLVQATPSALSAVQNAVPAPKRVEDQSVSRSLQ